MSAEQDRPKIIIDEDWKNQAQREKEALKQSADSPQPAQQAQPGTMPPATFPVLLSTLATQALVCLGQFPNPLTGKPEIHLEEAQHFIDTLAMLEGKTAGNRTPEESQMLDELLHELRMMFVHARSQPIAPAQ
jgi:hypothetical protein